MKILEKFKLKACLCCIAIANLLPFATDIKASTDNQSLYVEASLYAGKAIEEAENYTESLFYYQEAERRVALILEDKSSKLAVDMASGNLVLGGLTIHQLQSKSKGLATLAEAEIDILKAALLFASLIDDESRKEKATFTIYRENFNEEIEAIMKKLLAGHNTYNKKNDCPLYPNSKLLKIRALCRCQTFGVTDY